MIMLEVHFLWQDTANIDSGDFATQPLKISSKTAFNIN